MAALGPPLISDLLLSTIYPYFHQMEIESLSSSNADQQLFRLSYH